MTTRRVYVASVFTLGCFVGFLSTLVLGQAPRTADTTDAGDTAATAAARVQFHQPQPATVPSDGKLRIVVFGAHPDDAEIRAGGVAAMWAAQGHHVKLVAMTNGDVGHWGMAGGPLAQRRNDEVQAVAKHLGVTYEVFDIHDGELMPTLENRKKVVRSIRDWKADLVIAHRPNDYHPDHRYTGILVQDAAYMVTVPYFCPDTPYLTKNPVFMYGIDSFQRPNPFRPDIAVDIDSVAEKKLDAMLMLESQFVEGGCCDPQPVGTPQQRETARARARGRFTFYFNGWANNVREALIEQYGEQAGGNVKFAEAFEVCEYGTQPTKEQLAKLFPFEGRVGP